MGGKDHRVLLCYPDTRDQLFLLSVLLSGSGKLEGSSREG